MDPKKRTTIIVLLILTVLLGIASVFITLQVQRNNAPTDSEAFVNETIALFAGLTCEEVFAEKDDYAELGGFTQISNNLTSTGVTEEIVTSCTSSSISEQELKFFVELTELDFDNDTIVSGYVEGDVIDTDTTGDFTFYIAQATPRSCKAVILSAIDDFKAGVLTITESDENTEDIDCIKYGEDVRIFVNNLDTNL
jgi:hypothetical protein